MTKFSPTDNPNAPSPGYWKQVEKLHNTLLDGARTSGTADVRSWQFLGGWQREFVEYQWGDPAVDWRFGGLGCRFLGVLPLRREVGTLLLSTSYYNGVRGGIARQEYSDVELIYDFTLPRMGHIKPRLTVCDETTQRLEPQYADHVVLLEQLLSLIHI